MSSRKGKGYRRLTIGLREGRSTDEEILEWVSTFPHFTDNGSFSMAPIYAILLREARRAKAVYASAYPYDLPEYPTQQNENQTQPVRSKPEQISLPTIPVGLGDERKLEGGLAAQVPAPTIPPVPLAPKQQVEGPGLIEISVEEAQRNRIAVGAFAESLARDLDLDDFDFDQSENE